MNIPLSPEELEFIETKAVEAGMTAEEYIEACIRKSIDSEEFAEWIKTLPKG